MCISCLTKTILLIYRNYVSEKLCHGTKIILHRLWTQLKSIKSYILWQTTTHLWDYVFIYYRTPLNRANYPVIDAWIKACHISTNIPNVSIVIFYVNLHPNIYQFILKPYEILADFKIIWMESINHFTFTTYTYLTWCENAQLSLLIIFF